MTKETDRRFNDRRAIEERTLANESLDNLASIPHAVLSRLHEDEASAIKERQSAETQPIEVAAIDGDVVVADASGVLITLTPKAALLTSDQLAARAREAERQERAN